MKQTYSQITGKENIAYTSDKDALVSEINNTKAYLRILLEALEN